jgi:regulator of replication initiation timing
MVKKVTDKTTSERDQLVRDINYAFDASVVNIEDFYSERSFGTPAEIIETKGRLLKNIAGATAFAVSAAVSADPSSWFEQENVQLQIENYALRERIRAVEERLARIEATIPKERVIILQEISRDEAKEQIRNLFSTGRTLYYSDIAEELRLDLEMVVEICNELRESGEISIDARVS